MLRGRGSSLPPPCRHPAAVLLHSSRRCQCSTGPGDGRASTRSVSGRHGRCSSRAPELATAVRTHRTRRRVLRCVRVGHAVGDWRVLVARHHRRHRHRRLARQDRNLRRDPVVRRRGPSGGDVSGVERRRRTRVIRRWQCRGSRRLPRLRCVRVVRRRGTHVRRHCVCRQSGPTVRGDSL